MQRIRNADTFDLNRLVLFVLALAATLAGTHPAALAQNQDQAFSVRPADLTDREIQWAIDALRDGIYSRQSQRGNWERQFVRADLAHINSHESGQTSIALLALLAAGESYQEPRLQPAFDYILSQKSDYTYVRSLRAHIWAQLPHRFFKSLAGERDWLVRAYDYNTGSWNYTSVGMSSGYDNSLTQYGVLGVWESAKRGAEVPKKLWERVEDHFLRTQLLDGGWNYRPQWGAARGSMTAAGLTCLFITQDFLHASDYLKVTRTRRPEEEAIEKGLLWLDQNFTARFHPGGPGDRNEYYFYYYLYGMERVGLASGYRRFAEQDWFRAGAAAIINRMCNPVYNASNEIVGYELRDDIEATGNTEVPIVQLSFALMFLSHGRMPIIISKLRDDEFAWNNRPRDAANLARWISEEVEQRRSWQILDVSRPMEEWLDGPLVYLASHEVLPWIAEHEKAIRERQRESNRSASRMTRLERMKRYLELGGLLVTTSDESRKGLSKSVQELALTMFPQFEWRRLSNEHWAYTLVAHVNKPSEIYGLTNGVRELIIHFEQKDAGGILQSNERKKYADTFSTLSNIYYYASERGLTRPRLEPKLYPGVQDDPRVKAPLPLGREARSITVWRGMHEGNWDPEPAADELIALRLASERQLDMSFDAVLLSDLVDMNASSMRGRLLWVRGTTAFGFTERELSGMRRFADAGGVLFFETVGGVGDFGRLVERAIVDVYKSQAPRFRRLHGHPIITGRNLLTGVDCSRVTYRLYSLDRFGTRETRVRIRSLNPRNEDGKPDIFVSRDDLSYAVLDQPCWGISGYVTRDATHVIGNLIEFADSRKQR